MENNNERDYGQDSRNSQEHQNLGFTSTNDDEVGKENSFGTPEAASDANATGFDSGTNPDRYNSVNDGGAEGSSAESFTETNRYSATNSDFDDREDETIPDSDDLEDEEEEDDFDDFEEDEDDLDDLEDDSEEETRTPGL